MFKIQNVEFWLVLLPVVNRRKHKRGGLYLMHQCCYKQTLVAVGHPGPSFTHTTLHPKFFLTRNAMYLVQDYQQAVRYIFFRVSVAVYRICLHFRVTDDAFQIG